MPKRKTNLSFHIKEVMRKKIKRSLETPEEREARRAIAREKRALYRALESSAQRERRLKRDRIYKAMSRATESKKKYEKRLLYDRQRHALSRKLKAFKDKEALELSLTAALLKLGNSEELLSNEQVLGDDRGETECQLQEPLELVEVNYECEDNESQIEHTDHTVVDL